LLPAMPLLLPVEFAPLLTSLLLRTYPPTTTRSLSHRTRRWSQTHPSFRARSLLQTHQTRSLIRTRLPFWTRHPSQTIRTCPLPSQLIVPTVYHHPLSLRTV